MFDSRVGKGAIPGWARKASRAVRLRPALGCPRAAGNGVEACDRRVVVERLGAELLEEQHLLGKGQGPEERARHAVGGDVVHLPSAGVRHDIVDAHVGDVSRDISFEDQGPFVRGRERSEEIVGIDQPDIRPGLFGRVFGGGGPKTSSTAAGAGDDGKAAKHHSEQEILALRTRRPNVSSRFDMVVASS